MDIDRFVADCITANQEVGSQIAVNEVLARAVSTPDSVLSALGDPGKSRTQRQWNPETLEEELSDGAKIREMFDRENKSLGIGQDPE